LNSTNTEDIEMSEQNSEPVRIVATIRRYVLSYPGGYMETRDHLSAEDYRMNNVAECGILDLLTGFRRVGDNRWKAIDIVDSEPSIADNSRDDIESYMKHRDAQQEDKRLFTYNPIGSKQQLTEEDI
jgi:hypothetical protein